MFPSWKRAGSGGKSKRMKWIKLNRSKIRVYGKPLKVMMKGMTAPEEHTHFLHSLLTNNIKNLTQGSFNYNLWLRQNGQPVGDFFIYRTEDSFLLDTELASSMVIEEFERLKLSLKVFFEDLTESLSHIFIYGEGSSELVKDAFGVSLKDFEFVEKEGILIGRNPLRLKKEGYDLIGDLNSFLSHLPAESEVEEKEFEEERIRALVPRIGKELREGFSPLEACLVEHAIDMNKGCYVGQEAIARVYYRGRTPRVLALFEVEGTGEPSEVLTDEGKKVGLITSLSPSGKYALGYILRDRVSDSHLSSGNLKLKVVKTCDEKEM